MNKIVLLICAILLTGCGVKYPKTANLDLLVPAQSSAMYSNTTVFVHGHDARKTPEIIVYKVEKKSVVKVPNVNPPLKVIADRLTGGLREQGLLFETNSPACIVLELNRLLVTVTQPKAHYNFEAVSQITLKATNGKKSLTKKYNRQEERKSVFRPKITEMENMLNDQLSDIVTQILSDKEFQELIMQK